MAKKERKSKSEFDRDNVLAAITYIDIALENTDLFGRVAYFRWPNNRPVIPPEEHKEVMKAMLFWKREIEIFKELVIDAKDKKDDTTG